MFWDQSWHSKKDKCFFWRPQGALKSCATQGLKYIQACACQRKLVSTGSSKGAVRQSKGHCLKNNWSHNKKRWLNPNHIEATVLWVELDWNFWLQRSLDHYEYLKKVCRQRIALTFKSWKKGWTDVRILQSILLCIWIYCEGWVEHNWLPAWKWLILQLNTRIVCFFVSVSPLQTIECHLSGMLPPSFQMSQDAMPINTYSAVHITGNSQSYMATKRLHFPSYSTIPITGTPLARSKKHVSKTEPVKLIRSGQKLNEHRYDGKKFSWKLNIYRRHPWRLVQLLVPNCKIQETKCINFLPSRNL